MFLFKNCRYTFLIHFLSNLKILTRNLFINTYDDIPYSTVYCNSKTVEKDVEDLNISFNLFGVFDHFKNWDAAKEKKLGVHNSLSPFDLSPGGVVSCQHSHAREPFGGLTPNPIP